MSEACPICGGLGCRTYGLMLERFAAGRDVDHWRRVHDRINGRAPMTGPIPGRGDMEIRNYVIKHGCCH